MIEVIDLDDSDAEFLSIIDSIESEATRSASRTKRQKIETKNDDEEEGDYLAALKGNHSSVWKKNEKQHQNSYGYKEIVYKDTKGGNDVAEKMCVCGIGSCLVLTSNTVKNPGRKFYKCPIRQENGGCNFFEWCDNPSSGLPTSGRASTEGRNHYAFSNLSNESSSVPHQTSGNIYSGNQSSTERKGSSCFKCGKEGHCARDCINSSSDPFSASGYKPNPSESLNSIGRNSYSFSNLSTEPTSMLGRTSGNIYSGNLSSTERKGATCFKCGQEGHWARDCTNSLSDPFSAAAYKWNPSESSGSCFKCGRFGHWARDCTEQNSTANAGEKKKNLF